MLPALFFLGLAGLLVLELATKRGIECKVCVSFEGRRQCATARADDEDQARAEAQNSACSLLASGVSQAMKCPRVMPDEVVCK